MVFDEAIRAAIQPRKKEIKRGKGTNKNCCIS